jgi:hypothetical protein
MGKGRDFTQRWRSRVATRVAWTSTPLLNSTIAHWYRVDQTLKLEHIWQDYVRGLLVRVQRALGVVGMVNSVRALTDGGARHSTEIVATPKTTSNACFRTDKSDVVEANKDT